MGKNKVIEKVKAKILENISEDGDSIEKKEIMLFGMTRIIEDIPKYIGIILICFTLGILRELGIVFLVTACYKTFVGGVHLKTNMGCFIGSIVYFQTCIYFPKLIELQYQDRLGIYGLLYIFAIYVILIYVPADVPEIPIINKRKRRRDRVFSFIILNVIYLIAMFLIKDNVYKDMIILTIFYLNIMTTRIIYRIFGNKYGYETYIPDELLT